MAKLMTADELADSDQALVAKCCRWVKANGSQYEDLDGNNLANKLWVAMGYEGALNQFEALDTDDKSG